MSSLISGSRFIPAVMLRCVLGFVLVGLVATARAVQPDEDFFVPKFNLLTTRFVSSGADFLHPYQFSASVVFYRLPDTAPVGSGYDSAFQLPTVAKLQYENVRTPNTQRQQAYDGNRISLQHLLRVEFKGEQGNITFRPHFVSIERERLKVLLQPHSVSMLWNKIF